MRYRCFLTIFFILVLCSPVHSDPYQGQPNPREIIKIDISNPGLERLFNSLSSNQKSRVKKNLSQLFFNRKSMDGMHKAEKYGQKLKDNNYKDLGYPPIIAALVIFQGVGIDSDPSRAEKILLDEAKKGNGNSRMLLKTLYTEISFEIDSGSKKWEAEARARRWNYRQIKSGDEGSASIMRSLYSISKDFKFMGLSHDSVVYASLEGTRDTARGPVVPVKFAMAPAEIDNRTIVFSSFNVLFDCENRTAKPLDARATLVDGSKKRLSGEELGASSGYIEPESAYGRIYGSVCN